MPKTRVPNLKSKITPIRKYHKIFLVHTYYICSCCCPPQMLKKNYFYTEILTRNWNLWSFFMSETIHNTIFQVKMSV